MPERYEKAEAQIGTGQQGWVVFEQHAATWLAWVRTEAEADLIVSALNNLATAKAGLEKLVVVCRSQCRYCAKGWPIDTDAMITPGVWHPDASGWVACELQPDVARTLAAMQ